MNTTDTTNRDHVSILREALEQLYQMTARYAISDTDYGIVCNAAAALHTAPLAQASKDAEAGELPPLPKCKMLSGPALDSLHVLYTADQMHAYARAALARQSAPSSEPSIFPAMNAAAIAANADKWARSAPSSAVEQVIEAIKQAPANIAARADTTPKGNMRVEFPPVAPSSAVPFGYVVRQPDGHETYFKNDPTAFRANGWPELRVTVHTLFDEAAPTTATSSKASTDDGEPDMLWDAEDSENCYGDGPEDFANNYASNCMIGGDECEVDVLCAYRGSNRTMKITLRKNEQDEELEKPVSWSWVDVRPVVGMVAAPDALDALKSLSAKLNERWHDCHWIDPSELMAVGHAIEVMSQSAAPDMSVRDAEAVIALLDEVGAKLQTDDKSNDFWMGVGAMVQAGEAAIRALRSAPIGAGQEGKPA